MSLSTQTTNGRNGTRTDPFAPNGPASPGLAPAHPVVPITTTRPRASLAAIDAFRTLALTIDSVAGNSPIRSIACLSAVPGEGRSLTAEWLTLALSELRSPVRLLDADPFRHAVAAQRRRLLRQRRRDRPRHVADHQRLALDPGCANGHVPDFARIEVARDAYPGRQAFLQHVHAALDGAMAIGAQVVLDVPACSLSSIAFSIAQMVDGAIYVVRPDSATLETHREVLAQAALLKINVLGILLNEG